MEFMNKSETVTTFDGNTVLRSKARRIKGQYYQVDVSCFRIKEEDGSYKWYRINSGKIGKDHQTNRWDKINNLLSKGLVRATADKSNYPTFIVPDEFNNVLLKEQYGQPMANAQICLNSTLARELGYEENFSDGIFYKKENIPDKVLKDFKTKRTVSYGKQLNYNVDSSANDFMIATKLYNEYKLTMPVSTKAKELAKLLGHYSFGIEFETSSGFVPPRLLTSLGLIPLRDGSLSGHEYTTIPLSGAEGLETIKRICEILTERCTLDTHCSLHIHIGGMVRSYETLLCLHYTVKQIQSALYDMVPPYKKDPVNRAKLEKNYCAPLEHVGYDLSLLHKTKTENPSAYQNTLDVHFNQLFGFLSGGYIMDKNYNMSTYKHPMGNQKWTIAPRYKIFNLVPMVFSRNHTIESRLHHGTLNPVKVLNWLFISAGICMFVDRNVDKIMAGTIEITLDNVLKGYVNNFSSDLDKESAFGRQVYEYLSAYVKARTDTFSTYEKLGVWIPESEIQGDAKFNFSIKDFNLVP